MRKQRAFNKLSSKVQSCLQTQNGMTTQELVKEGVSRKQIRSIWGIVFDGHRILDHGGKMQYVCAWRYDPVKFQSDRKQRRSGKLIETVSHEPESINLIKVAEERLKQEAGLGG